MPAKAYIHPHGGADEASAPTLVVKVASLPRLKVTVDRASRDFQGGGPGPGFRERTEPAPGLLTGDSGPSLKSVRFAHALDERGGARTCRTDPEQVRGEPVRFHLKVSDRAVVGHHHVEIGGGQGSAAQHR